MELTNLIWHLGAAVAALWAAFAYRSVASRYLELRQAVIPSLCFMDSSSPVKSAETLTPVKPRMRSIRMRTVRWLGDEFRRRYGRSLVIGEQEQFIALEQAQWSKAVGGLLAVCGEGGMFLQNECWLDDTGAEMSAPDVVRSLQNVNNAHLVVNLRWNERAFSGRGGWQWQKV